MYLLKSILCMAIMLAVYILFLEKEKMHRFNRWYLLGSIVFSFIAPLITIQVQAQQAPVLQDAWVIIERFSNTAAVPALTEPAQQASTDYLVPALFLLYGLIAALLATRLLVNIYRLLSSAAKNKIIAYHGAKLVLLKADVPSHTFLNNIFLSEAAYTHQKIEEEVLIHELAHVKQKHSLDILFVEILQAVFWFNPLFILYKKAIQLNHEFLADDAVISTKHNICAYQSLLLEKITRSNTLQLTSSFHYSITKKRLLMMTRRINPVKILFKKLSLLPLLAAGVFIFSSKMVIARAIGNIQVNKPKDTINPVPKGVPHRFAWKYDLPVTSASGATQEELVEFNSIVARNTTKNKNGLDIITQTSQVDRNRLEAIFKHMNLEQRDEARVGFERKMDPLKKLVPTAAQLNKWKNPADYGVWIDGKKINNAKLNDYNYSDFSHYDASNLAYTEQAKKNIMEQFHLKVMYKVQLNLMTNAGYEKYLAESRAEPENTMYYHTTTAPNGNKVEWRTLIR
jgi:bla regulator protein BlaR1